MRHHGRRVLISRLCSGLSKNLRLKCFKRRRAQELTDANCAARTKRAKLLLQTFLQSATDFVFFKDKKMFSVASSDNRQTTGAFEMQFVCIFFHIC